MLGAGRYDFCAYRQGFRAVRWVCPCGDSHVLISSHPRTWGEEQCGTEKLRRRVRGAASKLKAALRHATSDLTEGLGAASSWWGEVGCMILSAPPFQILFSDLVEADSFNHCCIYSVSSWILPHPRHKNPSARLVAHSADRLAVLEQSTSPSP